MFREELGRTPTVAVLPNGFADRIIVATLCDQFAFHAFVYDSRVFKPEKQDKWNYCINISKANIQNNIKVYFMPSLRLKL